MLLLLLFFELTSEFWLHYFSKLALCVLSPNCMWLDDSQHPGGHFYLFQTRWKSRKCGNQAATMDLSVPLPAFDQMNCKWYIFFYINYKNSQNLSETFMSFRCNFLLSFCSEPTLRILSSCALRYWIPRPHWPLLEGRTGWKPPEDSRIMNPKNAKNPRKIPGT
jgi:hypothetical protein